MTVLFPLLAVVALLLPAPAARHDVHMTQSRVVVENGTVLWRVRCFADDLEKGLRGFTGRSGFALATDAGADSLVTAYFNAKVTVTVDGRRVAAKLLQSGRDRDPVGGEVRWYLLELRAGRQPKSIAVRQAMLAETFSTQQNLVIVLAMPSEQRRSLYFGPGDGVAQTVTF